MYHFHSHDEVDSLAKKRKRTDPVSPSTFDRDSGRSDSPQQLFGEAEQSVASQEEDLHLGGKRRASSNRESSGPSLIALSLAEQRTYPLRPHASSSSPSGPIIGTSNPEEKANGLTLVNPPPVFYDLKPEKDFVLVHRPSADDVLSESDTESSGSSALVEIRGQDIEPPVGPSRSASSLLRRRAVGSRSAGSLDRQS